MIRMIEIKSAQQAKDYFEDELTRGSYYTQNNHYTPLFHGRLAKRLGLENQVVSKEFFDALCDNINPITKEQLTPRQVIDRRVGYDISEHLMKSISIAIGIDNKQRLFTPMKEVANEIMREIEANVKTRVRVGGRDENRHTGEMLWACIPHIDARPVKHHAPDPHMHFHNVVFNVTWDKEEKRFKAGQFGDIKRDMPYYQARFHKRLAERLYGLGFGLRKTDKGFEITVIPQAAIDLFSKRTDEIGQVAKELKISDKKALDQLGAKTRSAKQKHWSIDQLRHEWYCQLKEANLLDQQAPENETTNESLTAKHCLDYALSHTLSRASVRRHRQVLASAYTHAVDNPFIQMDMIDKAFDTDERIYRVEEYNQVLCTTLAVQTEEMQMIDLARQGKSKLKPLEANLFPRVYDGLNNEQSQAIHHILTSIDRITLVVGKAGTGKTTMMKQAVKAIEKTGRQVFVFAPTSEAARDVLRSEGFEKAETVARFLKDISLQDQIQNQVVWVDEAGLLSVGDTLSLIRVCDRYNARLILSGDPKQHTSVDRGDAMRILHKVAFLPFVSVNKIYRQKAIKYREAVEAISLGQITIGFDKLDKLGVIQSVKDDRLLEKIANDYLKAIQDKKSVLIVTPTNHIRSEVNNYIRSKLRLEGLLERPELMRTSYKNLQWTEADKKDIRLYNQKHVIQFHQNLPEIPKGSVWHVESKNDLFVFIRKGTRSLKLPIERTKDFDVYLPVNLNLSVGDHIKMTKGGTDKHGRRLNNGQLVVVTKFGENGDFEARNPIKKHSRYTIDRSNGNFDYAYAMTSYASQGKTVDKVIIAMPESTFPAVNMKSFYVPVSRAKEEAIIYTDNPQELLSQASKSGDRLSAMELMQKPINQNHLPKALTFEDQASTHNKA